MQLGVQKERKTTIPWLHNICTFFHWADNKSKQTKPGFCCLRQRTTFYTWKKNQIVIMTFKTFYASYLFGEVQYWIFEIATSLMTQLCADKRIKC